MDHDNIVEFWIKGVPYVWIDGKSTYDCKRFYLAHTNSCSIFDVNNNLLDPSVNISNKDKEETFSILPFEKHEINTIRNYFLFWTNLIVPFKLRNLNNYKNLDIRVEGKSVKDLDLDSEFFIHHVVKIISPSNNYQEDFRVYPLDYSSSHTCPYVEVIECLMYLKIKSKNGDGFKTIKFRNLYEVSKRNTDLRRIHVEALKNSLAILLNATEKDKNYYDFRLNYKLTVDDIIYELKSLHESHDVKHLGKIGWFYDLHRISVVDTRICYDILTNQRPSFTAGTRYIKSS